MQERISDPVEAPRDVEIVHALLEQRLALGELIVPLLPEVAIRVVRTGAKHSTNAQALSDIISADPSLTMYVLRIATSAAKRPVTPIVSLTHAVAWLGFDEVANIAFTLALQGKMLDVPGQQHKARRLWRHSLACALWSRQLAEMLSCETAVCYLSGLLHNIGKVVTLGAAHDAARQLVKKLSSEEYDLLIETFYRPVGERVIASWELPETVLSVITQWEAYSAATTERFECNIVHVAHQLADCTLTESTQLARDLLVVDPAYRDLGFKADDAISLFDSASEVNAELDRYLAP